MTGHIISTPIRLNQTAGNFTKGSKSTLRIRDPTYVPTKLEHRVTMPKIRMLRIVNLVVTIRYLLSDRLSFLLINCNTQSNDCQWLLQNFFPLLFDFFC